MMLSDTKYQLALFSMIDYEGVEKRLGNMAAKGWEIEKAGKFLWEYRRTTPKVKKIRCCFFLEFIRLQSRSYGKSAASQGNV